MLNIVSALQNKKLFGSLPAFRSLESWAAWICWLRAVFGLPLSEAELAIYRQCTQRETPPKKPPRFVYTICGRRSGKSWIMSVAAVYLAFLVDYRKSLTAGERAVILCLARDREQSKIIFNYIKAIISSIPVLAAMVENERADEIELSNQVTILIKASDFRSVRGLTVAVAICDETAFWAGEGVSPDKEIINAIKPAMMTIRNSRLFVISSPYARAGYLFEQYRQFYGQESDTTLVWQSDSLTMNPTLDAGMIQAEIEADPEAARAEWLGIFREDIESFLSLEAIEACVVPGRGELPYTSDISYTAGVDVSGGRGDSFTCAIGHHDGRVVVDAIREWRSPFDPGEVTEQCSDFLKGYKVYRATGDKYGGEWPVEAFRKHGVNYVSAEKPKSDLYLEMLPLFTGRKLELPDDRRVTNQFRQLERRRGKNGKDSVDHPPGARDDVANSIAVLSFELTKGGAFCMPELGGERLFAGIMNEDYF